MRNIIKFILLIFLSVFVSLNLFVNIAGVFMPETESVGREVAGTLSCTDDEKGQSQFSIIALDVNGLCHTVEQSGNGPFFRILSRITPSLPDVSQFKSFVFGLKLKSSSIESALYQSLLRGNGHYLYALCRMRI